MSQVGVKEKGWNKGKEVEAYLASVKLAPGNPWCAAFVVWCHKQCGIKIVESGYSPSLFNKAHNVTTGKRGDVFGIYYPSKKRIAHVGFIDAVQGKSYRTVEGNTGPNGGREGDGVYVKYRLKSQVYRISRWT